ncbi:MAG: DUF4185 domain-containing protein [Candidatus Pseudobacter hemicellulosilyticus]|uniref:DUF4185 domain-containing protein n=1 Tax=Candidatus Pseudobacter hemicellulosilyticus TaxID=3121375 RepID=A0AAJ5WR76_9BACT|nr:MAG: DUF4185 domain-containing protein [Pseudobacter sp.]
MNSTRLFFYTSCLSASVALGSCQQGGPAKQAAVQQLDSLRYTVAAAPEWDALFTRNTGWFGGDGIFAVTRDGQETPDAAAGSETLIWFSDTMLGEIIQDSLKPGFEMINNSIATLQGGAPDSNRIRFHWNKEKGKNSSLFVPKTPATGKDDYYWLGDGFVNHARNNDLYIFGYRIKNISNQAFGFKEVGNTLVIVPAGSQPPFASYRQLDIPFFLGQETDSTGSFGAGIFVNTAAAGAKDPDGYVYIYGVRGKTKALMVARVQPESIESFDQWRFWDGQEWTADAGKIATVTDRLSNELGVMQLADGRYALTFQADGLGKYVALRLGASPVGPWGRVIELFDVSASVSEDKDLFPYNAKAHPVLSGPNELLISYNVNSFDFFNDIKHMPHLYRPRFVRVTVQP